MDIGYVKICKTTWYKYVFYRNGVINKLSIFHIANNFYLIRIKCWKFLVCANSLRKC